MQNDTHPDGSPWDNDEATSIGYLNEALTRLHDEIACIRGHWDDAKAADVRGDVFEYDSAMFQIAKHCENMRDGVDVVHKQFVMRFARPGVIAQLAKEQLEQMVGEPVEVVGMLGDVAGGTGFLLRRLGFDVPDDASELDEETGSG